MSIYEMAKMYYPEQWNLSRLEALVQAGKLSREEADEIINPHTNGK